ncbi:MAG: response regulator [Bacteroidota bacterium]|nr:response regulator [Bacteroidota bacterium]
MQSLRILIVEDEFIIANNLKMMLEDLGYNPYEPVMNQVEAIETLKSKDVDLVILDINLNGKQEGIDIGKLINEKYHIPFIYLTSNADKETINEAKQTKPRTYLIKPFIAEDIYAAIEVAVTTDQTIICEEEKLSILLESIFIKLGNKYYKVDIKDITYFEADGKMMNIHTNLEQKFPIRISLESLYSQLKDFGFMRIHRGFCINTNHLAVINSEFVIVNNQQIPIGRNYRDNLLGRIKTLS